MDALEFIRERNRMCKSFGVCCDNCPADKNTACDSFAWKEELVAIVEKWSKENPRKTRQSIFLEQYPEARMGDDGVLHVDPCAISASHRNAHGSCATMTRECKDCRREFWLHRVEC